MFCLLLSAITEQKILVYEQYILSRLLQPCITCANFHNLLHALSCFLARTHIISHSLLNTLTLNILSLFQFTVDSPTLALIAPLLGKALRGRSSVLKRKAARVIDNMCRLVKEPADVAPFMPLLLPALDKVIDEIVDAEVIYS